MLLSESSSGLFSSFSTPVPCDGEACGVELGSFADGFRILGFLGCSSLSRFGESRLWLRGSYKLIPPNSVVGLSRPAPIEDARRGAYGGNFSDSGFVEEATGWFEDPRCSRGSEAPPPDELSLIPGSLESRLPDRLILGSRVLCVRGSTGLSGWWWRVSTVLPGGLPSRPTPSLKRAAARRGSGGARVNDGGRSGGEERLRLSWASAIKGGSGRFIEGSCLGINGGMRSSGAQTTVCANAGRWRRISTRMWLNCLIWQRGSRSTAPGLGSNGIKAARSLSSLSHSSSSSPVGGLWNTGGLGGDGGQVWRSPKVSSCVGLWQAWGPRYHLQHLSWDLGDADVGQVLFEDRWAKLVPSGVWGRLVPC